mgnify:CR=1 FL=1
MSEPLDIVAVDEAVLEAVKRERKPPRSITAFGQKWSTAIIRGLTWGDGVLTFPDGVTVAEAMAAAEARYFAEVEKEWVVP